VQIYNEEVNDLLNTDKRNLSIKSDSEKGILVAGLTECLVYSPQDLLDIIARGDSVRHVGETKMNEASSRSHSIFRVVCSVHMCVRNRSGMLGSAHHAL
jgi:centromeric protein E